MKDAMLLLLLYTMLCVQDWQIMYNGIRDKKKRGQKRKSHSNWIIYLPLNSRASHRCAAEPRDGGDANAMQNRTLILAAAAAA